MTGIGGIHGRPKPSGWLITEPYDGGPVTIEDTVQCCHCFRHWVWKTGSGKVRGWCPRCNDWHCGSKKCCVCVPKEQWLDNVEQGRPEDFRPVIVTGGWQDPAQPADLIGGVVLTPGG